MSMDANRTPKVENLPELITNRRVGGMDMITAVRHALLADFFCSHNKILSFFRPTTIRLEQ